MLKDNAVSSIRASQTSNPYIASHLYTFLYKTKHDACNINMTNICVAVHYVALGWTKTNGRLSRPCSLCAGCFYLASSFYAMIRLKGNL